MIKLSPFAVHCFSRSPDGKLSHSTSHCSLFTVLRVIRSIHPKLPDNIPDCNLLLHANLTDALIHFLLSANLMASYGSYQALIIFNRQLSILPVRCVVHDVICPM
jgi:hypothetical protein